jgi:hypothetical protein
MSKLMALWNQCQNGGEREQGTDFFGQNIKNSSDGKMDHSMSTGVT